MLHIISLQDIFNFFISLIAGFFSGLGEELNNLWTADLNNEYFLKIFIFIIVTIITFKITKKFPKKVDIDSSNQTSSKLKKPRLSEANIFWLKVLVSYIITGLIVLYFGIAD